MVWLQIRDVELIRLLPKLVGFKVGITRMLLALVQIGILYIWCNQGFRLVGEYSVTRTDGQEESLCMVGV